MTELEITKKDLVGEVERRLADKVIEKRNADLLIKLINNAESKSEAMDILQMGTIYRKTGLVYQTRLEKRNTSDIKYFKKNEELSFTDGSDKPHHKLIIGDNFDALNNLLIQYRGMVDVVYIDPPYGKDSMGDFAKTNYENAISRDNLLSMLYTRLVLAKRLLSKSGVLFCSIDDRNQSYVRCLLDEVFGESAFLFNVPRQTIKGGKTTATIYKNHDYVLAYSLNKEIQFALLDTDTSSYNLEDEFVETRGKYKLTQTLDYASLSYSETMDYVLKFEGREFVAGGDVAERERRLNGNHASHDWTWRWGETDIKWAEDNKLLVLKENRIYTKTYEKCRKKIGHPELEFFDKKQHAYSSLMYVENEFSNNIGKKDLDAVVGDTFDNPKPVSLVQALINLVCNKEDAIILDFFAGSATTGHAVCNLNKIGEKKTAILCQINAPDEKNPHGIAYDTTAPRLKRIMTGSCYNASERFPFYTGSKDFSWLNNNDPFGGSLDVYEIETVNSKEQKEGQTAFDVIDETLYGQQKFTNFRDKVQWVCENFEVTTKAIESDEDWLNRKEEENA